VKVGSLGVRAGVLTSTLATALALGTTGCVGIWATRAGDGSTYPSTQVAAAEPEARAESSARADTDEREGRSYRAARPESTGRSYKSAAPQAAPPTAAPQRGRGAEISTRKSRN